MVNLGKAPAIYSIIALTVRVPTKQASIEHAVRVACDLYDEARFRQRLGLAQKAPTFVEIMHATLYDMRRDLGEGIGKSVYLSYITCIEKCFLPYFMDKWLEETTYTDVHEFEIWRNRQMRLVPKASTLYSLRHTYATLELLENKTDIHTLAKQMGNSAAMIERHYSKLTK